MNHELIDTLLELKTEIVRIWEEEEAFFDNAEKCLAVLDEKIDEYLTKHTNKASQQG